MEYNLNGKITLDDYIQFNKANLKRGRVRIFRIALYFILLAAIAFMCLPRIRELIYFGDKSYFNILIALMPLIAGVFVIILTNTIFMRRAYKKHYDANKAMQQNRNIKVNEESILTVTESGSGNLTKELINKIIYDKDSIYIYTGLNVAHILKKRFLEDEDDFEGLVKFIKFNYDKKPRENKNEK